ncbi:predicted protein [Naegleria gruberi]|uniref:Predicted protein n=1 Tax=Naegleria gruberi TaxID=5762 RepID=D2VJK7_NAEGR|nr:uncharacterized protein NAEGRDRAFT_69074 [Naegleria gruberi]EFC42964.1 predicted protein [Naegleria gruberi]|eukprot:XP_002675708.1 predicted protein [Naegleria gruberi strain NEG-M]
MNNNTIITDTSNSNSSNNGINNFTMETSMNQQGSTTMVGIVDNSFYSKPSPSSSTTTTRESTSANNIHPSSFIHHQQQQGFAQQHNSQNNNSRMESISSSNAFSTYNQQSSHHNVLPSLPSLSQMTTSSPNQIYPQNTNNSNLGNSAVYPNNNPYLLGNSMANNNTMMSPSMVSNDSNNREHLPPPPPSDFSYSSKQQPMFNQNPPTNNGNIQMMHSQMNQQHVRLSNMPQNYNQQQRAQNEDNLPSLQQFGLLFSQSLNIYPSSSNAQFQQNSKPPTTEKPIHQVYNDNRQPKVAMSLNTNKAKPLSVAPQNNQQVHTSSILNQLHQSQDQNNSMKNRSSKLISPQSYMGPYPNNPPTSFVNQPKYSNQRPVVLPQEESRNISPTEKSSMIVLPSNMVVCEGLLKLISHRIMETMLAFDEKTMKNEETKLRLQDEWNKLVNEYFINGRRLEGMTQVLHTLFGMLTSEPDIEIIKEGISPNFNKKGDHMLSIKFRANLRIVRLKICIFFLLFKLSVGTCFQPENGMEEFLETNSLVVDEKLFSAMTWEQFILEMDAIESKLRFKIDMITHEDNENSMEDAYPYQLNVKNNTMNSLVLESVSEEKLQASFNQLLIDRSNIERFKQSSSRSNTFRLRLSIQMSNYLTITKFSNNVLSIDNNYGLIESRSISTMFPLHIERAERKNKVVVLEFNRDFFVTPTRDKSDIDFIVELTKGDERKRVSIKNIYIDKIIVEYISGAQYVTVTRGQDVLCENLEIVTVRIHNNLKKLTIGTPKSIESDSPFSSNSTTPSPLCEESPSRSTKRALSNEDESSNAASSTTSPTGPKRVKSNHSQNMGLANIQQYVKGLRDKCGFSLLHIAAMNGFDLAIEFFNETISMPIDMTDNYQYSPYHWSCFSGRVSTSKLLISKGASTTRRNVHSATGIQIAEAKKHKTLITELEQELAQHACSVLSDLYSNLSESDIPFTSQNRSSGFDHLPHNLKIPQHKATKSFPNSSPRQQGSSSGESNSPRPKLIPAKKKKDKSSPTSSPFGSSKKSVKSNEASPVITSSPTVVANSLSQKMELFIKPSRKKRTYISFFPKELCSSPYKYDILLRIPLNFTNQFNESHFTFHLMIQGSDRQWMAVPEQAVEIVKYLRTMFPLNFREIEWRLMYKVCSFHYGRKPFKLRVIYNTNLNPESAVPVPENFATNSEGKATLSDNSIVYESEEFYIVARKKKENDYFHNDLSNGDDISSVTDQSPLTLDQSLNGDGLSPTSPDSPDCGPNSVFPRSSSPPQPYSYIPPNDNFSQFPSSLVGQNSGNQMPLPPQNLINPMSHNMIPQTILSHQQTPQPPRPVTQSFNKQ